LRIIGGKLKGKRLLAPTSIPARPTTDYAKESLFNILNNRISWSETNMLDLFAGIGSISLEAASRGALSVTCLDQNFHSIKWLENCKQSLKLTQVTTIKSEAFKWLKTNTEKKFDLIFADPPFDFPNYDDLIILSLEKRVSSESIFILEHRQSVSFAEHTNFAEERSYGEVRFTFFE
jgi:16S rRNA (guanine966-N2)-methyltransferase